jgi:transcriptional regulator with XRE-family HTH domain
VRELRHLRAITEQELADALGCARSTVSTWETKGQPPKPGNLVSLAHYFGVDPADLLEATQDTCTLRDLRVRHGYTQRQIAAILRVAVSTYCDVETGRQGLPERWVPILKSAYGASEQTVRKGAPYRRSF